MNQSKFSLADIITLLTASAFGFVCFLSSNFFSLGNTLQSIILGLVITILLGGTAIGAKLFKRTSRNFKTCFIWEMILIVLFTGLMIFFTYSTFSHYFVVSEQREEIQKKLTASIKQANNMFEAYELYAENRENLYRSKLQSVIASKGINQEYTGFGFINSSVPDNKQVANKMFTLHTDLFPSNYSDSIGNNGIKELAKSWLIDAKNKIDSWKSISIITVVTEVDQNSTDWLNTLVEISKVREKGEVIDDFGYALSSNTVKKYFTSFGNPTPFSIMLAVGAYILMLFSWFITKRDSRGTGSYQTAPYEVVL